MGKDNVSVKTLEHRLCVMAHLHWLRPRPRMIQRQLQWIFNIIGKKCHEVLAYFPESLQFFFQCRSVWMNPNDGDFPIPQTSLVVAYVVPETLEHETSEAAVIMMDFGSWWRGSNVDSSGIVGPYATKIGDWILDTISSSFLHFCITYTYRKAGYDDVHS